MQPFTFFTVLKALRVIAFLCLKELYGQLSKTQPWMAHNNIQDVE